MRSEFTGKIAVITGGARGIGRCIVEEFIKAGARVAAADKDEISLPCEIRFRGDIAEFRLGG